MGGVGGALVRRGAARGVSGGERRSAGRSSAGRRAPRGHAHCGLAGSRLSLSTLYYCKAHSPGFLPSVAILELSWCTMVVCGATQVPCVHLYGTLADGPRGWPSQPCGFRVGAPPVLISLLRAPETLAALARRTGPASDTLPLFAHLPAHYSTIANVHAVECHPDPRHRSLRQGLRWRRQGGLLAHQGLFDAGMRILEASAQRKHLAPRTASRLRVAPRPLCSGAALRRATRTSHASAV